MNIFLSAPVSFISLEFLIEMLKVVLYGIVEGITEWLPVSSTGHLILIEEFVKINLATESFSEMFNVVIQLGAILAVLVVFFKKIWPFSRKGEVLGIIKRDKLNLWVKIIIACIPAAIIGLIFDDLIDALFYNYVTVAIMLILVGVAFILVERINKNKTPTAAAVEDISIRNAFLIGVFQLIAAIFPGTSRSGATILGAIMLGVSRTAATEFTFFLGIPVMFGASLLKIVKFGFAFTSTEIIMLLIGMVTAFWVSLVCIRFLTDFIKRHSFFVFGVYRIILGVLIFGYFLLKVFNIV